MYADPADIGVRVEPRRAAPAECVDALADGVAVETFTESMPALLARTIPRLWGEH